MGIGAKEAKEQEKGKMLGCCFVKKGIV